jgi:vancomycin resistance protein YoaR
MEPAAPTYLVHPFVRHAIRFFASAITAVALVVFLGIASYTLYASSFQDRVYPGVFVNGLDLSGLNSSEAALQLAGAFTYPQRGKIIFRYGEKTWVAAPRDLGLTLDYLTSIHTALSVGRSTDDFTNALTVFQSRFDGVNVSPVLQYDARQTLTYLQAIASEINRPTVEATLTLDGGSVVAQPGQVGRAVDLNTMLALVSVPIGHLTDGEIPVMVHDLPPQILDASAEADSARALLSQNFSLTLPDAQPGDPGPWLLTTANLYEMLRLVHVNEADGMRYTLTLDTDKLTAYLQSLSASVVKPQQNARFTFDTNTGQLVLYRSAVRGRSLDIPQSVTAIQDAVTRGEHSAVLSAASTEPPVNDHSTAEQLGIKEELPHGWQYTSFAGSPPERIQNIVVASEALNGVLVAPGELFSMAKYIGAVGAETGYSDGLVIIGNKIVKGPGGGVCQVSTTLFRVALMNGFPIAARSAHALRVGYYENGDGPVKLGIGYDATVFLPEVDFEFVNDSPYYLLMMTSVDKANNRLNWHFYSTWDGRVVVTKSDGIQNETNPPDDQWIPDPTIPKKGFSFFYHAQKGADVTVHRYITRNGGTTQDLFKSHYLPWPNQCLYNPASPFPKGTKCPPK